MLHNTRSSVVRSRDWFLDWANEQLTDDERGQLARIAIDTVDVYAPLWQADDRDHDAAGRHALRDAVERSIARPLGRYGIALDAGCVATLLATG